MVIVLWKAESQEHRWKETGFSRVCRKGHQEVMLSKKDEVGVLQRESPWTLQGCHKSLPSRHTRFPRVAALDWNSILCFLFLLFNVRRSCVWHHEEEWFFSNRGRLYKAPLSTDHFRPQLSAFHPWLFANWHHKPKPKSDEEQPHLYPLQSHMGVF